MLLQKIIKAEQLDEVQREPVTAERFFIFNANSVGVDFDPLGFELSWVRPQILCVICLLYPKHCKFSCFFQLEQRQFCYFT